GKYGGCPLSWAGVFVPVGREKVNWTTGPREAGLGHDSARRSFGFRDLGAPCLSIRLERRNRTARASRAGLRPARPHCAQEGKDRGPLPLANHPLSFRTRCARK